MAIDALTLYGSWRKFTPSRMFISSQAKPKLHHRSSKQKTKPPAAKKKDDDKKFAAYQEKPQRSHRARASKKKWHEKRVDSEFDMVIVPSDGVSMSGSENSDDSDWSIGWFEPHSKKFTENDEESFAVLIPYYGSPPVATNATTRKILAPKEDEPTQQPAMWTTMLANLSRQSSGSAYFSTSSISFFVQQFFLKLDPKKWTVYKRGGPPSSSSIVSNAEKVLELRALSCNFGEFYA